MDAVGWIFLVGLIIVLAGYAYHKGTYNPIKALWQDLTKSDKASSNPR
jgi:hypothetical protein